MILKDPSTPRNMHRTLLLTCLLLLTIGQAVRADGVRFLATGDAPYIHGDLGRLSRLLSQAGDVDFMAHIGDIKSGASPCTTTAYTAVADVFRHQSRPVVFTPGDNDWTDCGRTSAGAYEPAERLALLRQLFFADPAVLRLDALAVQRPRETAALPELFWFQRDGVLFINWHVVGSYNNRFPRDKAAMAEYRLRRQANHHLLQVAMAESSAPRAVVIFQHANPGLGRQTPHPGYQGMQDDLAGLLATLTVPVLLIHGDTHNFQFDQPWQARPDGGRLWRLEVPGFPRVAGILVEVTRDPARPFWIAYRTPEDEGL